MSRTLPRKLTLLCLGALAAGPAWSDPATAQAAPSLTPLQAPATGNSQDEPLVTQLQPFEVTINGGAAGNWLLLVRQGALYATAQMFSEWRLGPPTIQPFAYRGQQWYPLASVPGYQARFNYSELTVALQFAPSAFAATRLVQEKAERPSLTPAIPTLFVNYDLSYTRSVSRGSEPSANAGGLFELGSSGNWGVLTSTLLGQNLTNDSTLDTPRAIRRLETTYTRNLPESNVTLNLGDSVTRAASWGRSIYFGGLKISRNFGLTPGFISQPLPVIRGVSAAPSTVDLYINDALRQTSNVPAGPFAIDNFPLLTGAGQARLVVRDVLGRETVIVQDFFSHSRLLEQGLDDWSAELGAVRDNLGTRNADYGQRFAAGVWRHGMSKTLTLEGNLEVGRQTRGAGLGLITALPAQILGQFAVAGSHSSAVGPGYLWQASFTHNEARHGFTLDLQGASPSYRQIGQDATSPSYRRQLAASYSYQADKLGSLGLGYAMVDSPGRGRIATYTGNYSYQLGHVVMTLSLARVRDPSATGSGTSIGLNVFVPFDNNISSSGNFNHHAGVTEGFVSVAKGLGSDTGVGWRALAGHRQQEQFAEGGLYLQMSHALTTLDVSQSPSHQTARLGAQGGLVWADGRLYASRRVSDSFGIVEVPGYPNVGINVYGSVVARTDANGRALVPRLLPYQENDIRLDPTELPISAELDSIEQRVVPAARSAVKIVFPVRTGRAALVKIVLDDGEPAPSAAELELVGDKEEFFVARRGEAFLTGLQDHNEIKLRWLGASCSFRVDMPPGKPDEVVRLGPLLCPGLKR